MSVRPNRRERSGSDSQNANRELSSYGPLSALLSLQKCFCFFFFQSPSHCSYCLRDLLKCFLPHPAYPLGFDPRIKLQQSRNAVLYICSWHFKSISIHILVFRLSRICSLGFSTHVNCTTLYLYPSIRHSDGLNGWCFVDVE